MKKWQTLLLAGSLSLAQIAQATPILRIFEMQLDTTHLTEFQQVGQHNIKTSITNEKGTLAMYSAQLADNPQTQYVLEIYQDDNAYQIHRRSPQFLNYLALAKKAVKPKQIWETAPQFIVERADLAELLQAKGVLVKFAKITVKPEHNQAFRQIVLNEMQQTMANEAGVLAMYAVTNAEQANQWLFFELYRNADAYQQHRQTAWFQDYLSQTKSMLSDKQLFELTPNTLGSKGNLTFIQQ
ncbi:putative quinol monooxygenase [Neisseria yangbaofengii]|uniref:putative quinol monooxygenase n=1 Tax=Neisseria yangbaofengii TaxID=2709396 RepID=UPI0013EE0BD6|nr:antibiotic biosynthesis monooxygenase [Neisseria yangbaofengii]